MKPLRLPWPWKPKPAPLHPVNHSPMPLPLPKAVFGPIGNIVRDITGVIRDPNGKISSKRAGAGACVAAAIALLSTGTATGTQLTSACILLGAGLALYALTKFGGDTPAGDAENDDPDQP